MTRRGLLLTMTEPPVPMEEEFNAWYDAEHLPERLAIPGFRSARRWVADVAPGEGKYLATYELDSLEILNSPAYLARFQNPTPWSKRCLGKTAVFKRWACEQIDPGDADPRSAAQALLFAFQSVPPCLSGVLQTRRFRASSEPRDIVLCELARPVPGSYGAYGS
jgi:hypothetical protein